MKRVLEMCYVCNSYSIHLESQWVKQEDQEMNILKSTHLNGRERYNDITNHCGSTHNL